MLPLIGSEEHISARMAAVIHIKTSLMRREDHIANGPPARRPRKKIALINT